MGLVSEINSYTSSGYCFSSPCIFRNRVTLTVQNNAKSMDAHAQCMICEVKKELVVYTIWNMSRMVFYYLDCFCDIWSAYLYTFCVLIVYIHILSFHIIVINSEIDCLSECFWFITVMLNLLLGNLKLYLRFINSSQYCDGASRSYPSPMKTRAYLAYTVNMVNDETIQGISSYGIDAVWPEYSGFHTRKLKLWDCCLGFISYQHVWIEASTVSGAKSYMIICFLPFGKCLRSSYDLLQFGKTPCALTSYLQMWWLFVSITNLSDKRSVYGIIY